MASVAPVRSLSRLSPAGTPSATGNGIHIHVFSPSSTGLAVLSLMMLMIGFVVLSFGPWDLVAHIPFSSLQLFINISSISYLGVAYLPLIHHSSLPLTPLMSNPCPGMELGASTALYPLHRCKTIYLVRHAQGIHNVAGEKDFSAYMSHDLFDAQLTPLGWSQVDGLRAHVKKSGLAEKIELVISSPLLRTMQTAVGVFGGEKYTDGVNSPPLMVENAGHSGRPAVSSLNCPPFIAVEGCREHLGVHPCDKRRSITEYWPLFPAIDFSLIENDEDVLWEPDVRETNEAVALRGMKFLDWLWTREEKEIAIVSHSGFLFHTLSMYSKECHPTIRDEVSKHFANCELRSMVLVDRSMLGSYSPRFNYPGKIPAGLDMPSDTADKKHLEEAQKS